MNIITRKISVNDSAYKDLNQIKNELIKPDQDLPTFADVIDVILASYKMHNKKE